MPRYIVERTIPGAAKLSEQQLTAIAKKSVGAIKQMGSDYQWHHSYVAGDKFYCVHEAPSEQAVREHARLGGFPIDRIEEIVEVVGPSGVKALSPA